MSTPYRLHEPEEIAKAIAALEQVLQSPSYTAEQRQELQVYIDDVRTFYEKLEEAYRALERLADQL